MTHRPRPGRSPEETLRAHVAVEIRGALERIPASDRPDVYIVSCKLDAEQEDQWHVTARIAWNTRSHVANAPTGARELYEWSGPNFIEPEAAVVAGSETDPDGKRLLKEWLVAEDLWFEDEDADLAAGEQVPEIWERWPEVVVGAVSELFSDGSLRKIFGREVPLFIDVAGLDETELREINRAANPASVRDSLDRWAAKPVD
jgi:hypothetical protein